MTRDSKIRGRTLKACMISACIVTAAFAYEIRWVYNYRGSLGSHNDAYSVASDPNGNIYAAGVSNGTYSFSGEWCLVSLTSDGEVRWVDEYEGHSIQNTNCAHGVVYGDDGFIYTAGDATQEDDSRTMFAVRCNDADGALQWMFRDDDPGTAYGHATGIAYGTDGNIYIVGYNNTPTSPSSDAYMIGSLTSGGSLRDVKFYVGSSRYSLLNKAFGVVAGQDGNIYSAGTQDTTTSGSLWASPVVMCHDNGLVRLWEHIGSSKGVNYCLSYGGDGNLYVGGSQTRQFHVYSLSSGGTKRWDYLRADSGDCYAVVRDADGDIYAAGHCLSDSHFFVVSLNSSGHHRWTYDAGPGAAYSICLGADGCIYVSGTTGANGSFHVVKLDASGQECWTYTSGVAQRANSIVSPSDGLIYAVGGKDTLKVVCISELGAIIERESWGARSPMASVSNGVLKLQGVERGDLLDLGGRKTLALTPGTNDLRFLPKGVYFARMYSREGHSVQKVILR